ncbi:MAG: ACT domain-containing protein [Terriglobales bacterium]
MDLRITINDRPGVLAQIADLLAGSGTNVDSMLQEPRRDKRRLPFLIVVEPVSEPVMPEAAAAIDRSGVVQEPLVLLRIGQSSEEI